MASLSLPQWTSLCLIVKCQNLTFITDALSDLFSSLQQWEQSIEVRAQIKALIHLLPPFKVVPISSSTLWGWYKVQSSAVAGITVMSPSLDFRANAERWPHSKLPVIFWGFMGSIRTKGYAGSRWNVRTLWSNIYLLWIYTKVNWD